MNSSSDSVDKRMVCVVLSRTESACDGVSLVAGESPSFTGLSFIDNCIGNSPPSSASIFLVSTSASSTSASSTSASSTSASSTSASSTSASFASTPSTSTSSTSTSSFGDTLVTLPSWLATGINSACVTPPRFSPATASSEGSSSGIVTSDTGAVCSTRVLSSATMHFTSGRAFSAGSSSPLDGEVLLLSDATRSTERDVLRDVADGVAGTSNMERVLSFGYTMPGFLGDWISRVRLCLISASSIPLNTSSRDGGNRPRGSLQPG